MPKEEAYLNMRVLFARRKSMSHSFTPYSTEPIYNIKAVTRRTGIPAPTLRAWERRYKMLAPRRNAGNYRLYSDRDIAVLRWLHEQVEAGLSISRAVALLENPRVRDDTPVLPPESEERENLAVLATRLFERLAVMDEESASAALAEAFAIYPIEDVCEGVITPALARMGDGWQAGHLMVAAEHHATAYLVGRLHGLLNAQPTGNGPLALVGCAPGERHEIGALMLAVMMRRARLNLRYLGADVPIEAWTQAIDELRPHLVAISATRAESAAPIAQIGEHLGKDAGRGLPVFVVGGAAFVGDDGPALPFPHERAEAELRATVQRIATLMRG